MMQMLLLSFLSFPPSFLSLSLPSFLFLFLFQYLMLWGDVHTYVLVCRSTAVGECGDMWVCMWKLQNDIRSLLQPFFLLRVQEGFLNEIQGLLVQLVQIHYLRDLSPLSPECCKYRLVLPQALMWVLGDVNSAHQAAAYKTSALTAEPGLVPHNCHPYLMNEARCFTPCFSHTCSESGVWAFPYCYTYLR